MKKQLILLLAFFSLASAAKDQAAPSAAPDLKATYDDMKATIGLVPTFMQVYPAAALPGAWEEFKVLTGPDTAIPNKYKELIGLAVASQVPCTYCVYAHTEFAKGHGASIEEIRETVALAAQERHWSTVLNGRPIETAAFKKETNAILNYMKDPKAGQPETTGELPAHEKEIRDAFGFVPSFLLNFPKAALPGAWRAMSALNGPNAKIPAKYRDLISLAVSAQVPCRYCVYFDSESAKANGATEAELNEAVAAGALTRHWSTVLNGNALSYAQFRKDVNAIIANAKKKAAQNSKSAPK